MKLVEINKEIISSISVLKTENRLIKGNQSVNPSLPVSDSKLPQKGSKVRETGVTVEDCSTQTNLDIIPKNTRIVGKKQIEGP